MSACVPSALLACVLIVCCCSVAMDCCVWVRNEEGYAIDDITLVTRAPRPSRFSLNQILTYVDKLKKHCEKTGYKGNRCLGVKSAAVRIQDLFKVLTTQRPEQNKNVV